MSLQDSTSRSSGVVPPALPFLSDLQDPPLSPLDILNEAVDQQSEVDAASGNESSTEPPAAQPIRTSKRGRGRPPKTQRTQSPETTTPLYPSLPDIQSFPTTGAAATSDSPSNQAVIRTSGRPRKPNPLHASTTASSASTTPTIVTHPDILQAMYQRASAAAIIAAATANAQAAAAAAAAQQQKEANVPASTTTPPVVVKQADGNYSTINFSSSGASQPLDVTDEKIPVFIRKTFNMVSCQATAHIVSWDAEGSSFIVHKLDLFSNEILPKYFRHKNFASFVRQLNFYGFHKQSKSGVNPSFAHEYFKRGEVGLLLNIKRKNNDPNSNASFTSGGTGSALGGSDGMSSGDVLNGVNYKELYTELSAQVHELQTNYESLFQIQRKILFLFSQYVQQQRESAAQAAANAQANQRRSSGGGSNHTGFVHSKSNPGVGRTGLNHQMNGHHPSHSRASPTPFQSSTRPDHGHYRSSNGASSSSSAPAPSYKKPRLLLESPDPNSPLDQHQHQHDASNSDHEMDGHSGNEHDAQHQLNNLQSLISALPKQSPQLLSQETLNSLAHLVNEAGGSGSASSRLARAISPRNPLRSLPTLPVLPMTNSPILNRSSSADSLIRKSEPISPQLILAGMTKDENQKAAAAAAQDHQSSRPGSNNASRRSSTGQQGGGSMIPASSGHHDSMRDDHSGGDGGGGEDDRSQRSGASSPNGQYLDAAAQRRLHTSAMHDLLTDLEHGVTGPPFRPRSRATIEEDNGEEDQPPSQQQVDTRQWVVPSSQRQQQQLQQGHSRKRSFQSTQSAAESAAAAYNTYRPSTTSSARPQHDSNRGGRNAPPSNLTRAATNLLTPQQLARAAEIERLLARSREQRRMAEEARAIEVPPEEEDDFVDDGEDLPMADDEMADGEYGDGGGGDEDMQYDQEDQQSPQRPTRYATRGQPHSYSQSNRGGPTGGNRTAPYRYAPTRGGHPPMARSSYPPNTSQQQQSRQQQRPPPGRGDDRRTHHSQLPPQQPPFRQQQQQQQHRPQGNTNTRSYQPSRHDHEQQHHDHDEYHDGGGQEHHHNQGQQQQPHHSHHHHDQSNDSNHHHGHHHQDQQSHHHSHGHHILASPPAPSMMRQDSNTSQSFLLPAPMSPSALYTPHPPNSPSISRDQQLLYDHQHRFPDPDQAPLLLMPPSPLEQQQLQQQHQSVMTPIERQEDHHQQQQRNEEFARSAYS